MNEKTLLRYLKVKALAEGGEAGEKDAARGILRRLEGRHPGIAQAADNYGRAAKTQRAGRSPPVPAQAQAQAQAQARGRWPGGNWEEIFRYAAGVYRTVQGVVDDVADAYYGQVLASEEVEVKGGSRADYLYIRVKVPFTAAKKARLLNAVQKEAFRQYIHDQLDGYLDALLEE